MLTFVLSSGVGTITRLQVPPFEVELQSIDWNFTFEESHASLIESYCCTYGGVEFVSWVNLELSYYVD